MTPFHRHGRILVHDFSWAFYDSKDVHIGTVLCSFCFRVLRTFPSPDLAIGFAEADDAETRLMESGLQLQQYLTPYPNQWNTHLGFPVQVHPPTPKERYAVLWGKNSKYFQVRGQSMYGFTLATAHIPS